MRILASVLGLWVSATAALSDPDTDQLVDAMGMPALIRAFSLDGQESGAALNAEFLNGQGGAVWAETVRKLYDPARLESELRIGLAEALDPQVARTALMFFDSDLGQRLITLEVQAREAMLDKDVADMAKAVGTQAPAQVREFIETRDLVERNTDAALSAQIAFFDGFAQATNSQPTTRDTEGLHSAIASETEIWLIGYYALMQSALREGDLETYTDFWRTQVGVAVDDAVFEVFSASYANLSFALGQAAGLLVPASEL